MLIPHAQLLLQLNDVALEETNDCCTSHSLQPVTCLPDGPPQLRCACMAKTYSPRVSPYLLLLPTRKKLLYMVANPARGLLNKEEKKKKKSGSAPPPPAPSPRAARSEKKYIKKKSLYKDRWDLYCILLLTHLIMYSTAQCFCLVLVWCPCMAINLSV